MRARLEEETGVWLKTMFRNIPSGSACILAMGGIQTELIYKSIVYGGMIPAETPPPSNRHALLVGKHGDSLIGNFIGSVTSPWGTFKHFFVCLFHPKEGAFFWIFHHKKHATKLHKQFC